MYGEDYNYANSRLAGTIVRNGDHPIQVMHVNGDGMVDCETVVSGRHRRIALKDLDLSVPPLGFVNMHNGLAYLYRKPMREDWRQGLRTNNVTVGRIYGVNGVPIRIRNKDIYNAIRGRHMRFESAIIESEREIIPVAFNRAWAVYFNGEEFDLLYKDRGKVGTIKPNGDFNLEKGNMVLRECLQEAMYENY